MAKELGRRKTNLMQTKMIAGNEDFFIKKDVYKTPMAAMHYHVAFEIYYLVHGEREYFIEDRFLRMGNGDFLIIPPGLLHRTAGKGADRVLIHFSESFLLRYFTKEALELLGIGEKPFAFHPQKEDAPFFESVITELLKCSDEERRVFYLFELLFRMRCSRNEYTEQKCSDQRIGEIVQYINEHYGRITTIEQIAEKFYLSKFYLCRLFAKELGVSLISYLNMIKIRAACAMLEANKMSLTEIAACCGFNSASYFCKVFKKEVGVSPKTYRAESLENGSGLHMQE